MRTSISSILGWSSEEIVGAAGCSIVSDTVARGPPGRRPLIVSGRRALMRRPSFHCAEGGDRTGIARLYYSIRDRNPHKAEAMTRPRRVRSAGLAGGEP